MAKRWLISYDLLTPGKDYQTLSDELKRLGARRLLYSQWIVRLDNTAEDVYSHLAGYLGADDRLLVSLLEGRDWVGANLLAQVNDV